MRIVFAMRVDAQSKRGGDTVQVENYVACLNRIPNVQAYIVTNTDYVLSNVDVVHLVNIDRPLETYFHYTKAKKQKIKKVCISSIHHPYEWIDAFEAAGRHGSLKFVNLFARDFHLRESLKNILRSALNRDAFTCYIQGFAKSLLAQQRHIMSEADHCFLLAESELRFLEKDLCIKPRSWSVVPNAVTKNFRKPIGNRDIDVLVVGRIEERKNQISIIDALRGTGINVTFVGALNPNNKAFTSKFLELVRENQRFRYLGVISHGDISEYYARSKVHLSASWFEVTPLVDVEAFDAGCVVVATQNSFSREFLDERAFYVNPSSTESIRLAVTSALALSNSQDIARSRRDSDHSWERAAHMLYETYQS